MADLRIQLFGAFHLTYGGELLKQPLQARVQSLLAYLILTHGAPQPRQHLAFSLWPDSSEEQAYNNLRKALFQLRSTLPNADQLMRTDNRTVQWLPDVHCAVDVIEFEQHIAAADTSSHRHESAAVQSHLSAAAALYSGDLLPGCYDDWLVPEREQLREQYVNVLQRLIDLLEQSLDYPGAIHEANCLLRADPLHEETYRHLMRLHALHGDRAAALRTYHTCATTLLRELGVDPSPLTQEAYARLLHLDPTTPPQQQPPAARVQDTLVGRKEEWRSLMAAWQSCVNGRSSLLVISGEAGAGKTRLAQEFARWADRQGINIARTRAYSGEEGLAYAPVIDWLHSDTLRHGLHRLEPVWLGEVARLAPDLIPLQGIPSVQDTASERWQRQRLFAALNRVVLTAEPSLILMVDDLQWCDQETLEWLNHLLHSAPAACLLVLGTVRTDEIDSEHPLSSLLLHLRSAGQITEIELGPMSEAETAELATHVAERPLPDEVITRLYQMTEGNPLFITESIRALLSEPAAGGATSANTLPAKVHAVILERLARLSPSARELANVAAVIGRSFTLAVLYQAYGADEDTLVRSLDELWQRRIVREQGAESYDFSHDLIRETAYVSVSSARRRLLHRRVAEALERAPLGERSYSAQIAWHYEQAGMCEPAIVHYSQAAATAHQMYAFQDAITYINRALDLLATLPSTEDRRLQEVDLQSALGTAWSVVKTYAAWEAKHAFDRAFALSHQHPASPRMFVALWGLHEFHLARSEYERGLYIAEECLRIAQELQDPALLIEAHHAMWGVLVFMNRYRAALEHIEQALLLYRCEQHHALTLQFAGHDPGHCGLSVAGFALWVSGYPDQARQRLHEAIELTQQFSVPSSLADAAFNQTMIYQLLGEIEATLAWAKTTVRLSTEYGYTIGLAFGTALAGWAQVMHGDYVDGLALLEQGMIQWQAAGMHTMQTYLFALWIEACYTAGRYEEAIAHADHAHTFIVECGEQFFAPEIYRLRGELFRARGDLETAESCYAQALSLAREQSAKSLELRAAVSLARVWQDQGQHSAAYDLLAPIHAWFREGFGTPDLHAATELLAELTLTR
jgi:DNA-binding SARP family transcriptional activator